MIFKAEEIDETVPVSDPEVWRILGVEHCDDPPQAVRRMLKSSEKPIPHVRFSDRRVRLYIPALKQWVADQLNKSVAASASMQ